MEFGDIAVTGDVVPLENKFFLKKILWLINKILITYLKNQLFVIKIMVVIRCFQSQ